MHTRVHTYCTCLTCNELRLREHSIERIHLLAMHVVPRVLWSRLVRVPPHERPTLDHKLLYHGRLGDVARRDRE